MRVLMMPDYRPDNPYQELLADALADQGVEVVFPEGYRRGLPFTRASYEAQADVLHLHWLGVYFKGHTLAKKVAYALKVVIDLFLLRVSGCRLVWTVHNVVAHDTRCPKLEMWLRRLIADLADGLIVHNGETREKVAELYQVPTGRVSVVEHGHYRDVYPTTVSKNEARNALGLGGNKERVFLHLGMLRPYKGVEDLLDVWPAHSHTQPDDHLIIAGKPLSDEYGNTLKNIAQPLRNVSLQIGFVEGEKIPLYYGAADIVVLPYRRVLTSGSAMLALTFGVPVIAPRIGEIPDTFRNADELLYRQGEGGLQAAMKKASTADLKSLAERTRRLGDERGWTEIAEKTKQVYYN